MDIPNDKKKSPFKNIHPVQAFENMEIDTKARFIVAVKNDNNEIVNTFIHDKDSMKDIFEALKALSITLASAQFGMLNEFLIPQ